LQQLREAIPSDHSYRFLLHDRDAIFSAEVDQQLKAFELRVLRTLTRALKANRHSLEELSGRCTLIASPQFLMPVRREGLCLSFAARRTGWGKNSLVPI
jgi:hypothetical protein